MHIIFEERDDMGQVNINIRMDEMLKKDFETLCAELGLNMTTAFNIFARAVVRRQGIPFEISKDQPNAEKLNAILNGIERYPKRYSSFSEILAEVDADLAAEENDEV